MRFPFTLFLLTLVLAGALLADSTVTYPIGRISATRALVVNQIGRIDPGTGVAMPAYESSVTITLANTGPLALRSVVVEENLDWLPPHARLSYDQLPVSNGRVARWVIDDLPSGGTWSVKFSLPTSVPDASAQGAGAPYVSFERPAAVINVPPSVEKDQSVAIRLRTSQGDALAGADIMVSTPGGRTIGLQTDSLGRASFVADANGFYTYEVPDYAVGFIPSTESLAPEVVVPPTTGSLTPVAPPKPVDVGVGAQLLGWWPFLVGGLLVAAMAFALYTYFSTMPGDDNEPMPSAPATRPTSGDVYTSDSADSMQTVGDGATINRAASNPKPAASGASSGGAEGSSVAASGASAALGSVSYKFGGAAGDEEVRAQTRDLLLRRRNAPSPPKPDTGKENELNAQTSDESEEGEPLPNESAASDGPWKHNTAPEDAETVARPLGFTEGTYTPDRLDEGEEEGDEGGMGESVREPGVRPQAPAWMTRVPSADVSESAEIDDEAIAKTIQELEQLRAELQARSKQGRSNTLVKKSALDELDAPSGQWGEREVDEERSSGQPSEETQAVSEDEQTSGAVREWQWPISQEQTHKTAQEEEVESSTPSRKISRLQTPAMARAKKSPRPVGKKIASGKKTSGSAKKGKR